MTPFYPITSPIYRGYNPVIETSMLQQVPRSLHQWVPFMKVPCRFLVIKNAPNSGFPVGRNPKWWWFSKGVHPTQNGRNLQIKEHVLSMSFQKMDFPHDPMAWGWGRSQGIDIPTFKFRNYSNLPR